MVATVLLGVVGLGITLVATRTIHNQRIAASQGAVVQHMRSTLEETGVDQLCETPQRSLTLAREDDGQLASLSLPLQVQCTEMTVQVHVVDDGRFSSQLPQTLQRIELRTGSDPEATTNFLHSAASIRMAQ